MLDRSDRAARAGRGPGRGVRGHQLEVRGGLPRVGGRTLWAVAADHRRRHGRTTTPSWARSATSTSPSREAELDDDLIVLAGDNLFSQTIAPLLAVRAGQGRAGARRLRRRRPRHDSPLLGVELDDDDRVTRLRGEARAAAERPSPRIALYFYPRVGAPLVREYLEDGNNPDQPGRLVAVAVPADCRLRLARSPGAGSTSAPGQTLAEADRAFTARRAIARHTSGTKASHTREALVATLAVEVSVV